MRLSDPVRPAGEDREVGPAEAVYVAARHGRSGELSRLLQSGVAPNWADRNGSTPLHQACMAGHLGCVQMLLEYHASIDTPDEHGVTPLMLSAMANRSDGVLALLSAGSTLDGCAEGGLARMGFWLTILQGTALQIAERAGNAECVALLRGCSASCAPHKPNLVVPQQVSSGQHLFAPGCVIEMLSGLTRRAWWWVRVSRFLTFCCQVRTASSSNVNVKSFCKRAPLECGRQQRRPSDPRSLQCAMRLKLLKRL